MSVMAMVVGDDDVNDDVDDDDVDVDVSNDDIQ